MQYRKLGRTDLQVSAISLGTEYLIDLPQEAVTAVIRQAISDGINYFDLFFVQKRFRDQMGQAFSGHRESVYLAAHLGAGEKDGQYQKTRDLKESEFLFQDFLQRFRTTYVDVLFVHNVDSQEDYDLMMHGGFLDTALKLQKEGKARFIGFSGHTVSTSRQAIETGEIDLLMFPINLTGNALPGRKELFQTCVKNNIGLIGMKPFAGGKLLQANNVMDLELWQVGNAGRRMEKNTAITPLQCLAYCLEQTGVSTVVPGCKDLEQLAGVLAYFQAGEKEKDFSSALAGCRQFSIGECVYCNHCLPCPQRIDVGLTMRLLDLGQPHPSAEVRAMYQALPVNAADCIQCGDCEGRCPFKVKVMEKMEQASGIFG
jgi:uncharacterized protein